MSAAPQAVSLYDARPFFEKALAFGVQHGLIDAAKREAMCTEAPKGMVQIARYFGTEFLRPELELARDRMVNLVSLYLEHSSGGDLQRAAESLRDHSLLSRSKGGSDMLKALIAMPQSTHFGMNERGGFRDEHIPLLAKWTLRSLPDYQAELALRSRSAAVVDAALWIAQALGLDEDALEESGKDAEAVIRTGLLALALKRTEMPDWVLFEKMVLALRKKFAGQLDKFKIALPKDLPSEHTEAVEAIRQSLLQDAPKWLDSTVSVRKLFDQTPAFMGRYFWQEDMLAEVEQIERANSKTWDKATEGNEDESSLLTMLLCMAAGSTPKTLLSEKAAATLVRKIRKSGLQAELPAAFIEAHAPVQHREDYASLWANFIEDAATTLQSDHDYTFNDAVALLRRECNIGP